MHWAFSSTNFFPRLSYSCYSNSFCHQHPARCFQFYYHFFGLCNFCTFCLLLLLPSRLQFGQRNGSRLCTTDFMCILAHDRAIVAVEYIRDPFTQEVSLLTCAHDSIKIWSALVISFSFLSAVFPFFLICKAHYRNVLSSCANYMAL